MIRNSKMFSIVLSELPRAKVKPAKSFFPLSPAVGPSVCLVHPMRYLNLRSPLYERISCDFPAGSIQALPSILSSWFFKLQAAGHNEKKLPTSPSAMLVLACQSGFQLSLYLAGLIFPQHIYQIIYVFKSISFIIFISLYFQKPNHFLK